MSIFCAHLQIVGLLWLYVCLEVLCIVSLLLNLLLFNKEGVYVFMCSHIHSSPDSYFMNIMDIFFLNMTCSLSVSLPPSLLSYLYPVLCEHTRYQPDCSTVKCETNLIWFFPPSNKEHTDIGGKTGSKVTMTLPPSRTAWFTSERGTLWFPRGFGEF